MQGGARSIIKAERAVEPIISAGASGVMAPKTLSRIIESGQQAARVMRGIL